MENGGDLICFYLNYSNRIKKDNFYLNNYGNHERDFTYIEDVSKIILKLININTKDHHIFNISSNNPININRIIKYFSKNKSIKIKKIKKHKADMIKTMEIILKF